MKLTMTSSPLTRERTFTLVLDDVDLARVPLDPWDRFLIHDVEANLDTTLTPVSDSLLALHAITWRLEQARERQP